MGTWSGQEYRRAELTADADPPSVSALGRSAADLHQAQIRAIRACIDSHCIAPSMMQGPSRDTGFLTKQHDAAHRRVLRAINERAAHHSQRRRPLASTVPLLAVIAHRSPWFRTQMTKSLASHGIEIVGTVDDGADAIAAIVAEQPDLIVLEKLLPTVPGIDVVTAANLYAPAALVWVQATHPDLQLQRAGADTVFPRTLHPDDIAAGLLTAQGWDDGTRSKSP